MRLLRYHVALALLVAASACPDKRPLTEEDLDRVRFDALAPFSSSKQLKGWLEEVKTLREEVYEGGGYFYGCSSDEDALDPSAPSESPEADASITNNQVEGVDEGGIVKAVGDYFVILRRGRLFSVRQTEASQPTLRFVSQVDARPRGSTWASWYDEMLIHDDVVVVVGYSYEIGGTEIARFRLSAEGELSHLGTHFIGSNDYYSSRNYASRLVDGKLIFYMPAMLFAYDFNEATFPTLRKWTEGNELGRRRDILTARRIFRPIQGTIDPILHTVVICDLEEGFACDASGVVGPFGRTFHVSRDAVYLWVSEGYHRSEPTDEDRRRGAGKAMVYRLPLDGSSPSALRAFGHPIDQFSFLEKDGFLNVLINDVGMGDWMWSAETRYDQLSLALMRVPLERFDADGEAVSPDLFRELSSPGDAFPLRNRFVGDHLMWGGGRAFRNTAGTDLHVLRYADPNAPEHRLPLEHAIERLEAMGGAAMAVGSGRDGLGFSSIDLGGAVPTVADVFVRQGAAQSESRSHGYFFRPSETGGGTLGLPVRKFNLPQYHYDHGSAEIVFLQVSPEHEFETLGALEAQVSRLRYNDNCKVSCTDWYGNARPIFYRGRIFALMGYELVEGQLGAEIREVRRLDFTP